MSRTGLDLTEQLGPFVPADTPSETELDALRAWLPGRRWFPVKHGSARIEPWMSVRFGDGSDPVIHLLRVQGEGDPVVVQVPVVRRTDVAADAPERIAELDGTVLIDACYDPEFWASWLALAQWGEADSRDGVDTDLAGARVLAVEQSNTSILFPQVAGGAICKVFRTVAVGANPDVDIPRALVQAGWAGVPRPYAWLELASSEHGIDLMDLGVLCEFVDGASDGFQLACAFATDERSFADQARDLGRTVAEMHLALARAMPSAGQTVGLEWLRTELRRRARGAVDAVDALGSRARAIEQLLAQLGAALPDAADHLLELQHVHGDLHLGQALWAEDTGWRILDFEGEPMRPVAERIRPDLPVRDVAGMLRSFDYAAAVGQATDPQWALDAREAFLAGYRAVLPAPDAESLAALEQDLVLALELDKALYEVVYEANNRPDWLWIPLQAVDRILTQAHG
jgi:maltokinase